MPNPAEEILEFKCPKCAKRLKAGPDIAGRKIKCPKCAQIVRVPGVKVASDPAESEQSVQPGKIQQHAIDDLWLSLEEPAIEDVRERELTAAEVKAKKQAFQASKHRLKDKQNAEELTNIEPVVPHSRRQAVEASFKEAEVPVEPKAETDDDFTLAPLEPAKPKLPQNAPGLSKPKPKQPELPAKASVFDDDLPDLTELDQPPTMKPKVAGIEDLGDLDELIPELDDGGSSAAEMLDALPGLLDVPDTTDHEFRILCKVCGTPQYVKQSTIGMKIKCPDCYSDFKVPRPPPGWSPKKKSSLQLSGEDMPLEATNDTQQASEIESKRNRTSAILEKAKQEISDDDLDGLYGSDFDTAGFLRRTFGFLNDPIAVAFVIGYGIVFACVFALAQYGLNNRDSGFGRGALLVGVIGAPLIGILFGLPMLSSALALLESVANRQKRVADWPGFDMFDNFGDLLAIAAALIGALLPGFLLGYWLGGDGEAAGRIQIAGMMVSIFLLFPVFMLSILDNGSLFQPVSSSVLSSLKEAAEAWGGYFLKTMIVFSVTVLIWALLLGDGKPPAMAAAAGFIVSPLVFFTFQQLGSLADAIGEHLSFEFTPKQEEDESDDIKEVVEP